MDNTEYKVSGYSFTDLQVYKEAKREAETIEYIKANTDLSDKSKTLKLYHKLVERKTLKTIVGYSFLKELQDKILQDGIVSKENLPCIKVEMNNKIYKAYSNSLEHEMEQKKHTQREDYRIRLRNSRIVSLFLCLIIVIMFIIAITSDLSKFVNYENNIINKYSAWEEELNERERAIEEREELQSQE